MRNPLQQLKQIVQDRKLGLSLAEVRNVYVAEDRRTVEATVQVLPVGSEVVARLTWQAVGPDAGAYFLPSVGDWVIVGFVDGQIDQCYILSRLTSLDDKIPMTAITGDAVLRSLKEKKTWITSEKRINLSKKDEEPTENLVLGQIFKNFMINFLDQLIKTMDTLAVETHISAPPGYLSAPPQQKAIYMAIKAELEKLKASPIEDIKILSELAFTEK